MNQYLNYSHKELWDPAMWDDRYGCVYPLMKWLTALNSEKFRFQRFETAPRENGYLVEKIYGYEYPDFIEKWKAKGLTYNASSITNPWIAMAPPIRDDMTVLVVPVDVEWENNPNWTIHVLEYYGRYLEMAAEENVMLFFLTSNGPDVVGQYATLIQELGASYHLTYEKLYLDVSNVYRAGFKLKEVPDFSYVDGHGMLSEDPDAAVEKLGAPEIPALPIGFGRWATRRSLTVGQISTQKGSNTVYDVKRIPNSLLGKRLVEGVWMEYTFEDVDDPKLHEYFERLGVRCEKHSCNGFQWISIAPKNSFEEPKKKLPLLISMKEVNTIDPHQAITAFSYCREYIDLASQGDCIVLFFAMETQQENDLIHVIIQDAAKEYPVDLTRVYLTGHSHNGYFTFCYAARNPDDIAGIALLGDTPDLRVYQPEMKMPSMPTPELAEKFSKYDIPTILISGMQEMRSLFPLYSDAHDLQPGFNASEEDLAINRMKGWQLRLRTHGCNMKTIQEIEATRNSKDIVERLLGIPSDKTDVLYWDGFENYIADIRNESGKYHLRIVGQEGMPHCIQPTMVQLLWSYLRRFAKDPATKECIELY